MNHVAALLILTFTALTRCDCPTRCACTENSVTCVSKDLENVPSFQNLTNNPVIIDLSGNCISLIHLEDFIFDKNKEVKEIYLNNSGLIDVEEQTFKKLENLQELYISNNFLNSLPENIIADNHNMILLDLSQNYFTDMPKIKSKSLEVLTIANSGISKLPRDVLDGLPSLRILLLPQNNLKTINPRVFDRMSNLFFINVAYNPWQCSCKTVTLFNYLIERKFIDLTEPVQCLTEKKTFVKIFSDSGVEPTFGQNCINFDGSFEDNDEETSLDMEITLKNLKFESTTSMFYENEESEDVLFGLYYSAILVIAITFSLITGAICGSYITMKYMKRNISLTESTKELLCNSDEKFITYKLDKV